jgi:hypothetical protein
MTILLTFSKKSQQLCKHPKWLLHLSENIIIKLFTLYLRTKTGISSGIYFINYLTFSFMEAISPPLKITLFIMFHNHNRMCSVANQIKCLTLLPFLAFTKFQNSSTKKTCDWMFDHLATSCTYRFVGGIIGYSYRLGQRNESSQFSQ